MFEIVFVCHIIVIVFIVQLANLFLFCNVSLQLYKLLSDMLKGSWYIHSVRKVITDL